MTESLETAIHWGILICVIAVDLLLWLAIFNLGRHLFS